jgi:hypothetical protein
MKIFPGFLLFVLLFLPGTLGGETSAGSAPAGQVSGDVSYLIPQTVFVGDAGRLVLPLGLVFAGVKGAVVDAPEALPRAKDLVISRIELENRGTNPRLLVDFIAYAPGIVELPPVKIASFTFTDLQIRIASILETEENSPVLSGPETPLAAPGTSTLIYGTVLGFILLFLVLITGILWGLPWVWLYRQGVRRRRILRAMDRILRQQRNNLLKRKAGEEKLILVRISSEFRSFLALITGENCRALVPREFIGLPLPASGEKSLSGQFLAEIFRDCDALRFSGCAIGGPEVLAIIDRIKVFIDALDRAEGEARRAAGGAPGKGRENSAAAGRKIPGEGVFRVPAGRVL